MNDTESAAYTLPPQPRLTVPAVEVLSAEKTYPNGTQALLPVDLSIAEGEFVTLLGPSGCGKSTLLKMVAGMLEPTDGRLLVWRKPVAQIDESGRRMAFVFQSPTLMPWASVRSNVRLTIPFGANLVSSASETIFSLVPSINGLSFMRKLCPTRGAGRLTQIKETGESERRDPPR